MQVRGLGGEYVDALVQIPVGRGLRQPVIAPQVNHARVVAEPAQHQFRLRPGRASPLKRAQIMGPAVTVQQAGEVVQGFDRHVADGRVGEHVGSLQRMVFCRFPSCSRALRHASQASPGAIITATFATLVRKPQ